MNNTINRYLAILCFPFNSLDFFWKDYFNEMLQQKILNGRWEKKLEDELKEKIIKNVQKKQYLYSYDEAYLYLESCYLDMLREWKDDNSYDFYMKMIDRLADSMISQRDGRIVYKYWKNMQDANLFGGFGEKNKIFLFHSLNMCVPLDTPVIAFIARNPINDIYCLDNYYAQIEIADQQLEQVLKEGVAENHLHKGVARSFLDIWEGFMHPITTSTVKYMKSMNINVKYANAEREELLFYILAASVARVWLSLVVRNTSKNTITSGVISHLVNAFADGTQLKKEYQSMESEDDILTYYKLIWDSTPYQENEGTFMRNIFEVPDTVHTSDENIFLFNIIRYFYEQKADPMKVYMFKIFLQYLRIKNFLFGCTVQGKSIRGLDYFQKEYYRYNSKLLTMSSNILYHGNNDLRIIAWEQIIRKQFQNQNLRKIEFRLSIDDNENKFKITVLNFLKAYRNVIRQNYCIQEDERYKVYRSFPRVGLVYHLLKSPDNTTPEKCILDGMENPDKIQFGMLSRQYQSQIKMLKCMRDDIEGLDRYIVGIDAASLENATPLWVFVPAYNSARDSRIERMGYANASGKLSLRFTFHAGEDFRHLLSGLRRIDETVEFLKFHAGDRIGHGTALGISPEKWRKCNPVVILPRIEALENYVWAYYVLSKDNIQFQSTLMAYIERRVNELAGEIYEDSQGISIEILIRSYLMTFSCERKYLECSNFEDAGFCEQVRNGNYNEINWNVEKLVKARHCKKFLKAMEHPISYEVTQQDIEITSALQDILKRKISRAGIIVEINPSSNIVIGELDKINDSQVFQLNKPGNKENIMVCINSDDPAVFNTNVSNELAYIYYGMLYNGESRETALEWIDKIRECGMKASFVQNDENDQFVFEQLEKLIDRIEGWIPQIS